MRRLTVTGLSADGRTVVLQDGREGTETFEVPLDEVAAARRPKRPADLPTGERPSPREIQQRIRHGESAVDIARMAGVPVEDVARYEGPVLAEREHHARLARSARVDGHSVEELVEQHLARLASDSLPVWDCWLTPSGRWQLRARAGREVVRFAWDPLARRVTSLDDVGRQVLRQMAPPPDALRSVLQPLAGREPRAGRQPLPGSPPLPGRQPVPSRDPLPDREETPVAEPLLTGAEPLPGTEPLTAAEPQTGREPLTGRGSAPRPTGLTRTGSARRPRASVPAFDDLGSAMSARRARVQDEPQAEPS